MGRIDDVLSLVKAGYTKTEIDALLSDQSAAPAAEPEPAAAPAAEPEPAAAPAADPEPVPTIVQPVEHNPELAALTKQLGSLITTIQKSNLAASQMPAVPEVTAEDVLANIIYPQRRK